MWGKISASMGGALLGAFGIAATIFFLFSLPLAMLTLMRWYGWEWWHALVAASLLGIIPFFGQLAFLVLAVIGCYHLTETRFDWQAAAFHRIPDVQFSHLQTKMKSDIREQCEATGAASAVRFNFSLPAFCDCYSVRMAGALTQEDLAESMKMNAPPRALVTASPAFRNACIKAAIIAPRL